MAMQMLRNKALVSSRAPQHTAPITRHCNVAVPPRRDVCVAAKRRQLDRDYPFVEVYQGVIGKLRERNHLSVRDMTQLIECIKSPEQAKRCLDILAAYIAAKSAAFASEDSLASADDQAPSTSGNSADSERWLKDWPFRKRFVSRIAEIAVLELKQPELVYAVMSNMDRFKLSKYFGKDLILQLGKNGAVSLDILGQIARLVQQQRGPADKGTKGAWIAVLQVTQDRGGSAETLAAVQEQLKQLRTASHATDNATAPAPVAAMA